MITGNDVARAASDAGFRAEVVGKVLRLRGILGRLNRHRLHPTLSARRDWFAQTVEPALDPLLEWSIRDSRFFDIFMDEGELVPEALHDESEVQDRIRRQPVLKWKAQRIRDPETGQRYTVKRDESEKATSEDVTWRHVRVVLRPNNPAFEPIVLTAEDEETVRVVAEVVTVFG